MKVHYQTKTLTHETNKFCGEPRKWNIWDFSFQIQQSKVHCNASPYINARYCLASRAMSAAERAGRLSPLSWLSSSLYTSSFSKSWGFRGRMWTCTCLTVWPASNPSWEQEKSQMSPFIFWPIKWNENGKIWNTKRNLMPLFNTLLEFFPAEKHTCDGKHPRIVTKKITHDMFFISSTVFSKEFFLTIHFWSILVNQKNSVLKHSNSIFSQKHGQNFDQEIWTTRSY